MSALRKALVTGSLVLVPLALVGCSAGTGKDAQAKAESPEAVVYEADYPAYDSLDDIVKTADVIVRGTVVDSRVTESKPEVSTDGDPLTNPQAGLSAEEAAETDPVVITISTVKVSEVLSGPGKVAVGDTVEVSQLGGTLDGVAYEEQSTTTLSKDGTDYVLMLAEHGEAAPYDLLNPEQALYTVEGEEQIEPVTEEGFDDIGTVDELAETAGTAETPAGQ
ncbi:hypothetical protein [Streptomyces luteogriseus]|uniref:hypothetical protein n=1 Tax=Streptomyces luteogriseus TaxID=68233 RepID=UPI00260C91C2|nr:hypothetical protein [Streptomyces luteogriseus]WTJ29199.1 hypothetical protein OID52_20115 [Streptomyces luteogriseus]